MLAQVFRNFEPTQFALSAFCLTVFFSAPLLAFETWVGSEERAPSFLRSPWWQQLPAWAYLALMLVVFQAERTSAFIYFQF